MLSKTHKLTEEITTALGPLFHDQPDYSVILQAMGLVVARISMATPNSKMEHLELTAIHEYAKQALKEFLKLELEQAKQKALVEQGVAKFAKFFTDKPELGVAALNGGMGSEARAAAEKAQGIEPFTGKIEEGADPKPGKFRYKVVDGELSAAGKTLAKREETEQARLDTYKED